MRRTDDGPMPPEVVAALEAVDATLAGDPVDPEYAELAELALILRRERPVPAETFAAGLDERVQRRFARPARPTQLGGGRRRRWLWAPGGAVAAGLAGVLVVLVVAGGGGGSSSQNLSVAAPGVSAAASSSASSSTAASAPTAGAPATANGSVAVKRSPATYGNSKHAPALPPNSAASASATATTAAPGESGNSLSPAPGPVSTGNRQIVQGAQLQLTAAPNRIDDVAQRVFQVVANVNGIVENSNVTATGNSDGNAQFQLSVPSSNLSDALTALSELPGAKVASRSDSTSDITGQVGGAGERLAEARALRQSLLKQLADATTTDQVDSIKAQLNGANASIASNLATLRKLQHQVAYSLISVNIQAAVAPVPVTHNDSFTIGHAAHDAGRVLVVVAGGALIALAVLVPVGLVVALLAWVGLAIRRHRREQALDLV
jgi:hypothetical protein